MLPFVPRKKGERWREYGAPFLNRDDRDERNSCSPERRSATLSSLTPGPPCKNKKRKVYDNTIMATWVIAANPRTGMPLLHTGWNRW